MTVVVCTDSRGGMLFMGRRVSRDREMIRDLMTLTPSVVCHPRSEKYLAATPLSYRLSEDPLAEAGEEDFCFIEHLPLAPYLDRIDRLIVYSWGVAYPFDLALDIDPRGPLFRRTDCYEFVGHSHTLIQREIFEK